MKIIIIGTGKVGKAILEHISKEGHDLCIIDSNPKIIDDLVNRYDISGVSGNGASYEIQKKAEVNKADIVITCTSSDEVNILACMVAKKIGAKNTIARIRNRDYYEQVNFMKKDLGLSMIINPEQEAANEIVRILDFPQALKIDTFAKGKIDLMEIYVNDDSPLVGLSLQDIRKIYQVQVLVCAIQRENEVFIPHGSSVILGKDKINITGNRNEILKFLNKIGIIKARIDSVIIIGGGKIGYYLCQKLIKNHYKLKVIENSEARCLELSELFPEADIICADGTDQEVLFDEGINHTGALISLTGIDEENIITSMYANNIKVPKIISKVNRDSFASMFETTGMASIITPKNIAAIRVVSYVRALNNSRGSNVVTLYKLVNNEVEALEFNVNSHCQYLDIPLKDVKFKKGILFAAIIRNNETIIPGANDCLKINDSVIVVSTNKFLDDLNDLLL